MSRRPRSVREQVMLRPWQIELIDRLQAKTGKSRSDIVRRLAAVGMKRLLVMQGRSRREVETEIAAQEAEND